MKIGDVLKGKGSGVVTMRPNSTIDTVVRRMRLDLIHGIPPALYLKACSRNQIARRAEMFAASRSESGHRLSCATRRR